MRVRIILLRLMTYFNCSMIKNWLNCFFAPIDQDESEVFAAMASSTKEMSLINCTNPAFALSSNTDPNESSKSEITSNSLLNQNYVDLLTI